MKLTIQNHRLCSINQAIIISIRRSVNNGTQTVKEFFLQAINTTSNQHHQQYFHVPQTILQTNYKR